VLISHQQLVNISVGSNPSTLEINGAQFYPLPIELNSGLPAIYVSQVPASVSLVDIKAHPAQYTSRPLLVTSFRYFLDPVQTVNYEGNELLTITIQLGSLEQQEVNVPDLSITVLKDTEGSLAILRIDQGPVSDSPKAGNKECNDWPLLCKLKAIVANHVSAIKGNFNGRKPCGGMMRKPGVGKIEGAKDADREQEEYHRGKHPKHPAHGHGHHGWHRHHHHKLHRVLHAIARVLLTVLVPILIGVAAGMLLYLVGYVIGATLGFIVGKLVGHRPRYQVIALTDDTEQLPRDSMEKFEYRDEEVEADEAPPEYVEVEGREVQVEDE
jgi:hypothetical protein